MMGSPNPRRLRTTLPALLLACLILAPGAAQAQTGEDAFRFAQRNAASGPRMMGMAGAGGYAGMADFQAFLNNPAGLGLFTSSMVGGALQTLSTADLPSSDFALNGAMNESDIRKTGLTNLAYAYKVPTARGSFVVGAAYNQVNPFDRELIYGIENRSNSITDFFSPLQDEFDITTDASGNIDVEFFRDLSALAFETYAIDFDQGLYDAGDPVPFLPAVSAFPVEQEEQVTETGSTREFNLGGAVEAARGVHMGLSANLAFGRYQFDREFNEFDLDNANDGSPGSGTVDFASLTFNEGFESKLVGVNARAGVTAFVIPGLRAGVSIETPTFYNVNEDYYTTLTTRFDTPDADGNSSYTYGGVEGDPGTGAFEYQITTPWRLGGGLAFTSGPVTLAGDAEFVDWSQMRLRAQTDRDYFTDVNQEIRQGFDAAVNLRVGAEFDAGPVALRAGYGFLPDPRDYESGAQPIDRGRNVYSAGLSFQFAEQVMLDFGWMRDQFDDQYSPYFGVANGPDPVVYEKVNRDQFAVGLRYAF